MGRLPILTASVLKRIEPTEMAAMQEPWQPSVKVWSGTPYDSDRGASAEVGRGPMAVEVVSIRRLVYSVDETMLR